MLASLLPNQAQKELASSYREEKYMQFNLVKSRIHFHHFVWAKLSSIEKQIQTYFCFMMKKNALAIKYMYVEATLLVWLTFSIGMDIMHGSKILRVCMQT